MARDGQILATPTLVREFPRPVRRLIGNLSNAGSLFAGLDLATLNGLVVTNVTVQANVAVVGTGQHRWTSGLLIGAGVAGLSRAPSVAVLLGKDDRHFDTGLGVLDEQDLCFGVDVGQ